jgi:diaminopropionate ammonia-lyase
LDAIQLLSNHQSPFENKQKLPENFSDVERFHLSMPSYSKTPIHCLSSLANLLHVKGIYVKDESTRFGLNAFKGLGVSYALNQIMKNQPRRFYTFVSCTDGNHGKALAWQAHELGYEAIIFMPKGSEERRVKAIEQYHAKVIVTDMNYDDTVRYAAEFARDNDAYLVQDTSLPGYIQIPNDIVLGYSTMVKEALDQMHEKPTHVFIQAGVGSLAGGVVWYLQHRYQGELPFIGVVEAESVACIYESVKQNKMVSIGGEPYTAMAGLNCGEANPSTFPLLKAKANCFIKCSDEITFKGMSRAQNPIGHDVSFSSGESGAVALGLLEEIMTNPVYQYKKEQLQLDSNSIILLFSTEGEIFSA